MCASRCRWMDCRGQCTPALTPFILLLLPLSLLSVTFPFTRGDPHISKTLLQPPVLTEMPTPHTIFSPYDINLRCEATGTPTPTFRWVKDGELFGSEHVGSGTLKAEELDNSLDLYEGHFRCYASNSLGTAMTQTVKVIVESQPVMQKPHLIRKTAFEGESIIMSCNPPESSTPPTIHWMNMNLMHIARSERVTLGLDGKLYFANVDVYDAAVDYICHAQYTEARTIFPFTAISLTVKQSAVFRRFKPDFFHPTANHSRVMALRGHKITLECIPKGLPTPKVEWKKKDAILENTTGWVTNFDRWLHFGSITQDDDGEYECKASNIHGFATRSFTVTVEAAPYWVKKPQSLMYAPGETVTLDCQADGTPKPNITWRINGVLITEVDEDPRRTVSSGLMILRDADFGDTAVYQCEATNVHDSILLNAYVCVIEPTQTSCTVMNSTVTVSWNKAQKVTGQLLGYKIYIKRLGPLEGQSLESGREEEEEEGGERSERGSGRDEDSLAVVVNPDKNSTEVTGLRLFSRYELVVTAFNSKGQNPHTQPHHFNTPEGAPGPPASLRFESPTEKSLILFWTPPLETNGILQGYTVQYQQEVEGKDSPAEVLAVSDPTVNTVRLDHLDPDSHYVFNVRALTRAGVGPTITRRGATLLYGVPPSSITVVSNITSVSLSWVLGERCRHDGFRIHCLRRSGEWEESEVVSSAFYTLTGLEPGTVYHLRMTHGNKTVWEGEAETAGRLSITSWLIRIICTIIITTMLVLILIIPKWRQGSKYREHPLTATPGSACEDSTYQSLDPASRDLHQTCSAFTHHTRDSLGSELGLINVLQDFSSFTDPENS